MQQYYESVKNVTPRDLQLHIRRGDSDLLFQILKFVRDSYIHIYGSDSIYCVPNSIVRG